LKTTERLKNIGFTRRKQDYYVNISTGFAIYKMIRKDGIEQWVLKSLSGVLVPLIADDIEYIIRKVENEEYKKV